MSVDWCKENYEASVTSRAWGATPYDAGWEESAKYGEDLPGSAELRAIFDEEMALGGVPEWAGEIVERMIGPLPMCGHYAFPLPVTEIGEAIGRERAPEVVHGCYTADRERKILMSYYVYCLDAWLSRAPLEAAQAELARRPDLGKDWAAICKAVYETLGESSRPKTLLVRRLIQRLRWWVKTLIWDGDRRDQFGLDAYGGDVRGTPETYGNPPFGDPYFAELRTSGIEKLTEQIRERVPEGRGLLDCIESTWLCAPKVFRYLERIILGMGALGSGEPPDDRPILQCEDTVPDVESHRAWYESFMASLSSWLDGDASARPEIGEPTPVRHWLVRILRHKLRLYEEHDPFGNLVGVKSTGRRGTKTV